MPYATAADLDEFIRYLHSQIGMPYVWGGQHTSLTPSNYIAVIDRMESDPNNADTVKRYCRRKFAEGYTQLWGYDCSGLGMYFWFYLKSLISDTNADGMMRRTTLSTDPPKRGWWLYNTDSTGRAYHVGYMVDDMHIIQAYGRKVGVIKNEFVAREWSCWGIPNIFEGGVVPGPTGSGTPGGADTDKTGSLPPEAATSSPVIEVIGKRSRRVNVRRGPSTKYRGMFTAHGGDRFPLLGIADTGWYYIATYKGPGYITNKAKYTRLLEE